MTLGLGITTAQVSVTTSATLVFSSDTSLVSRALSNQSGMTIYIGAAGVTTLTGFPIPTGSGFDASRLSGALYAVVATGTAAIGTIQY